MGNLGGAPEEVMLNKGGAGVNHEIIEGHRVPVKTASAKAQGQKPAGYIDGG